MQNRFKEIANDDSQVLLACMSCGEQIRFTQNVTFANIRAEEDAHVCKTKRAA
jgi:RNase P subunit RPR2